MFDQLHKLNPTGQLTVRQAFNPRREQRRLGLSLGLAVLGLGCWGDDPAVAFMSNPAAEPFSNNPAKVSLAKPKEGVESISQPPFQPSWPMLMQSQTPSIAKKFPLSGRIKLPPKKPADPWRQAFRLDNFEAGPAPPAEASTAGDPELGILRLREQPLPVQRLPVVYLSGGVDYLNSDNIFLETEPVNDQFVRAGLSLVTVPALSPQTSLFASVGGSLLRYSNFSDSDYNELSLQAGITQRLFPQTFGQLSWSNQQLFEAEDGERFFNDHSVRLALGRRDQLLPLLGLDTFYQLRFSFSDPNDFSRFIQTLGVSLSYDIAPKLQISLNYQLTLADFTQQTRYDTFNQIFGQVSFNLTPASRFNLFGGFSFGDSSDAAVDFDDTIFGVSLDVDLPLF